MYCILFGDILLRASKVNLYLNQINWLVANSYLLPITTAVVQSYIHSRYPVTNFLNKVGSKFTIFTICVFRLGSIAAPGGTVFALLVLIVLALLGGQLIKLVGVTLSKIFRVNIALPPLLGWSSSQLNACSADFFRKFH